MHFISTTNGIRMTSFKKQNAQYKVDISYLL
jgi:hypothetical protein